MSSRSLAAARSRRAGENAPTVSGNRPITSIGSQAAFSQQSPPPYQNNTAKQPNGRGQQKIAYQQVQQSQQAQTGLPFSKLSISDAIGLITLRLGRVEQWVIETEHENENEIRQEPLSNLPENSKVIDNGIFNSIIDRIGMLENKETASVDNTKLSDDVIKLTEQLTRIGDEGVKQSMLIAKHTEQLFRFERELVETKDILKTFMIKYDLFVNETNGKFGDFEYAFADLEKNIKTIEIPECEQLVNENDPAVNDNSAIMSVDLKNIIKQELSSIN